MHQHQNLQRQFGRIGARLLIRQPQARWYDNRWSRGGEWRPAHRFRADVLTDRHGEYFELLLGDNTAIPERRDEPPIHLTVSDVRPRERHLVLRCTGPDLGITFLMGHDERHWFVADVPGQPQSVLQAMEALKPPEVVQLQKLRRVKRSQRNRRRNEVFRRQGEWFFIPAPDFEPGRLAILQRNEPIRRGAGKPHVVEEVCRVGGTTVMVNSRLAPNGITMDQFNQLDRRSTNVSTSGSWRAMTRDATVYGRGRVRHPDHKTIRLQQWHRVLGNIEPSSRFVAFLD